MVETFKCVLTYLKTVPTIFPTPPPWSSYVRGQEHPSSHWPESEPCSGPVSPSPTPLGSGTQRGICSGFSPPLASSCGLVSWQAPKLPSRTWSSSRPRMRSPSTPRSALDFGLRVGPGPEQASLPPRFVSEACSPPTPSVRNRGCGAGCSGLVWSPGH